MGLFDPAAHATIEQFQPYNGPQRPKNKMLANIHDLVNTDKHRIVTPAVVDGRITLAGDDHGVTFINIKDQHEMMFMIREGTDNPGDELKPQISPSVPV